MSLALLCDHACFIESRIGTQIGPQHQGSHKLLEHHRLEPLGPLYVMGHKNSSQFTILPVVALSGAGL